MAQFTLRGLTKNVKTPEKTSMFLEVIHSQPLDYVPIDAKHNTDPNRKRNKEALRAKDGVRQGGAI